MFWSVICNSFLCILSSLLLACEPTPTSTQVEALRDSLISWQLRADSGRGEARTLPIGSDFVTVFARRNGQTSGVGRLDGSSLRTVWSLPLTFPGSNIEAGGGFLRRAGSRICSIAEWQRWCVDEDSGVLLWSTPDANTGESGLVARPIFRSDFAYIALKSGAIREVDLVNGQDRVLPARTLPRGDAIIAGTLGMQVSSDTLLVASAAPDTTRRPRLGYQYLYLISLPSGQLLTRFDPPDDSTHVAGGAILSFQNLLILNAGSVPQTVAIEKSTGRVVWRYRYDGPSPWTLPHVVGDTGFIAGNDLHVHAVNLRTGQRINRSTVPTTGSLINGLVVCKNHIIAASDYLYAFERDGAMKWRRLFGGEEESWIQAVSTLGFPTLAGETVVAPLRDFLVGLK